ncbi:MAG: WD40 repeat domain-containing protein [Acidobacteria bacterium]|nr:WD40 repeat domain-containing protein [Acidobacteriota bacterium]
MKQLHNIFNCITESPKRDQTMRLRLCIALLLCFDLAPLVLLYAQQNPPQLVVQKANLNYFGGAVFSHDSQLLAIDNLSEVLILSIPSGRLLGSIKAEGTIAFSPDDAWLAILPMNISASSSGAPPLFWRVDTGNPVLTDTRNDAGPTERNLTAPSTAEVMRWTAFDNKKNAAKYLKQGKELIAVSSDGRLGAVRLGKYTEKGDGFGYDQKIQLIDLKSGETLYTLNAVFEWVLGTAFSIDGRYFAEHSTHRRFIGIWDTTSGREVAQIKQDVEYPHAGKIEFSPDGKWLAAQYEKEISLFDTNTWQRIHAFPLESSSLESDHYVFSPDGSMLAVTLSDRLVIINIQTGSEVLTLHTSLNAGNRFIQWNGKAGILGVAGKDFIRLWNTKVKPMQAPSPKSMVSAFALSPEGRRLACGTRDSSRDVKGNEFENGWTELWQIQPELKELDLRTDLVNELPGFLEFSSNSIAFSPDGKTFASATADEFYCESDDNRAACKNAGDQITRLRMLSTWDTANGKLVRRRKQPDPQLNIVVFSPDGKQIATGQQDQLVKIYDAATLNRIHAFPNPSGVQRLGDSYKPGTTALAYSPEGKWLLAGSDTGPVWLLDTSGKKPLQVLRKVEVLDYDPLNPNQELGGTIIAALFSQDGKRAYAVTSTGRVLIWDTLSWTKLREIQTYPGESAAALSPNGKVLAIANLDGAIRFYHAETGVLQLVVVTNGKPDSELVISPDMDYDYGNNADLLLAHFRIGRNAVSVDKTPGSRRVPGLFKKFLSENQCVPSTSK